MRHVLPWYCADFGDFTSSQCCSPAAWPWQDTTRHSKGAAHPPTAGVQHLQVATALLSCANLGGLLAVTWNPPWSTCINCELKRLYWVRAGPEADDCGRGWVSAVSSVIYFLLCFCSFSFTLWMFVMMRAGPASTKLRMFLLRKSLFLPS